MGNQAFLTVDRLDKRYGAVAALDAVSLTVETGEFVCLVGPSGCGKTTLLRTIAGLESQDSGSITLGERDISFAPPQSRDYGILFQSYALFPNLTVGENVGFGLQTKRTSREHVKKRVGEMLDLVGLGGFEDRYPSQLSGGQQQRVGMARALAPAPSLLLLDEPMSALDAKVREHLQSELRALQKRLGVTTVMVTHDQNEAMAMADRIAVMNRGRVEQVGSGKQLYCEPATRFVADFIGDANWLDCVVLDSHHIRLGQNVLTISTSLKSNYVKLCVRPESVQVFSQRPSDSDQNILKAEILEIVFLGTYYAFTFKLDGIDNGLIRASVPAELASVFTPVSQTRHCWLRLPPSSVSCYE